MILIILSYLKIIFCIEVISFLVIYYLLRCSKKTTKKLLPNMIDNRIKFVKIYKKIIN